jgi:hypothetical protein
LRIGCSLRRMPTLHGLRRWLLFTRDAHALYARAGFTPLANPLRGMERLDSDVYIGAFALQAGIDLSGELR